MVGSIADVEECLEQYHYINGFKLYKINFFFNYMRHQLIYSPVLLVLGSGESRPSTGGPSSFPLGGCGGSGGGESWQF